MFQRRFDDYGHQREAARKQVDYRHPWVLSLDADEVPDGELVEELKTISKRSDIQPVAYRMRRKDFFMGRWIRHASLYPTWFIRFYRPDSIHYPPRPVHEHAESNGPVGQLSGHLIHDSFRKGMDEWNQKHQRYAKLEAQSNMASLSSNRPETGGFFFNDPVKRRRFLKEVFNRLPFRPTIRFLYTYLWRGGFLDGQAGRIYCQMLARYEKMIARNLRELRKAKS